MSDHPADHDSSATCLADNGQGLTLPAPRMVSRRRQDHHALRPSGQRAGSRSPLGLGFAVPLGVLIALALVLAALSDVTFDVFAAMVIALSLNPLVNMLIRRGLSKGRATNGVADTAIQQIGDAVEQPSIRAFIAGRMLGLGAGLAGRVSPGIFMAVLTRRNAQ